MQDPLTCRKSAQSHASLEKISQRRTETSVTHRSTPMSKDLGCIPRMLPLLQCANSQKFKLARSSPMTTPSLSPWAMGSGLRSLNRMPQLSSVEFAPMLLSRRTISSPESEQLKISQTKLTYQYSNKYGMSYVEFSISFINND